MRSYQKRKKPNQEFIILLNPPQRPSLYGVQTLGQFPNKSFSRANRGKAEEGEAGGDRRATMVLEGSGKGHFEQRPASFVEGVSERTSRS